MESFKEICERINCNDCPLYGISCHTPFCMHLTNISNDRAAFYKLEDYCFELYKILVENKGENKIMDIKDYQKSLKQICNFYDPKRQGEGCCNCPLKNLNCGESIIVLDSQQIDEIINIIEKFKSMFPYCHNCNLNLAFENLSGIKYCPYCGTRLQD